MTLKSIITIFCSLLIALGNATELKSTEKPKIGILTSGGDCSGLNSIIYAAYKKAESLGYDLIGFRFGVHGVIQGDYITLDNVICNPDILKESGSILKSNTKALKDKDGKSISKDEGDKLIIDRYHELNLQGLIYIGGDGSVGVMKNILKKDPSLNIVAVPKTIDNDISNTDVSVGFSTVTKNVTKQITIITSTAKSHSRVMVVEVMGRAAGYIALTSGIAVGADAIIIPEIKCDINKLIDRIKTKYASGKDYAIVVVSEGVEFDDFKYEEKRVSDTLVRKIYGGVSKFIADKFKEAGFDAKAVILGHIQRGGTTSVEDRILAQKFGVEAVELVAKKDCGNLIGISNNKIIKTKLNDIKTTTRKIEQHNDDVKLAQNLGIYVGEINNNF